MDKVFIIGLPTDLRVRVQTEANRRGVWIGSVLADVGTRGTPKLLPYPGQAAADLMIYADQLDGYDSAYVIVLPYAPLPHDLLLQLDALKGVGGTIVWVEEGKDGWPPLERRRKPDTTFRNAVFNGLLETVFPGINDFPSAYFRALTNENPRVLFAERVFESCDDVPVYRRAFLKDAADAFARLVENDGHVGRIDSFFEKLGLDHAQSGGVSAHVQVYERGALVYEATSHAHLKRGDNTTPQAASRVYYQPFKVGDRYYVSILHAGPHPDEDITAVLNLDDHS